MEVAVELKHTSSPSGIGEKVRMQKKPGPDTPISPYLVARREWDERYGDLITRARNWRLIAILCATAAVLQTLGLIALAMRAKVVPYVVAIDSLGHQVAAGPAEQGSVTDDRLKHAELFQWIEDLRTVTSDGVAQRKEIDRVYARLASGSPALTVINEFYRAAPPQHRAQTESVSVDVQSVLATSDKTYQIEWTETTRDLQGQIKSQDRWKGAFTIAINPPSDERTIRANPLGIYITNVSWTRVL
jgi:type IV secretion system protein TrbF